MKLLLANAVPLICVAVAAFLAYKDVTGWGWFLVIAYFFGHVTGNKSEKKVDSGDPSVYK